MAFCKHHSDPTCNECRDLEGEEQKKNLQKEIVSGKNEKSKNGDNLGNWRQGLAVLVIAAGLAFLLGWLTFPGFLKPDKEVALLGEGGIFDGESLDLEFVWKGQRKVGCYRLNNIGVSLRNDGGTKTTLLLRDRISPDYICCNVTVLVPSQEDLDKWNKLLTKLRNDRAVFFSNKVVIP